MKKVIAWFLILGLSIFAQTKEQEEEFLSNEKVTNEESEPVLDSDESVDKNKEKDFNYQPIWQLIDSLTPYYQSNGGSTIQKEIRKKEFKRELTKINSKYVNTDFVLNNIEIEDIYADTEITKYGLQKIKTLTKQLMKDPSSAYLLHATGDEINKNPLMQLTLAFYLAGCTQCFRENGKYIVSYSVPEITSTKYNSKRETISSERYKFTIKKTIASKTEALKLSRGAIVSLNAKIVSIDVDDLYTKYIKIYLK